MNPSDSSQGGAVPGANSNPSNTSSPNIQPVSYPASEPLASSNASESVLRGQINAIYQEQATNAGQPAPNLQNSQGNSSNPYNRTHQTNPMPQEDQWKAYHSAWQQYYQKYYSSYYNSINGGQSSAQNTQPQNSTNHYFSNQTVNRPIGSGSENNFYQSSTKPTQNADNGSKDDISKNEALFNLRQKLIGTVKSRATKIRKSRHFIPITAALLVMLIFTFLQYNRVIIASVSAYVSPGAIDPQNIVIDPSAGLTVSPDPRLIIPKINVDVPAIYGIGPDYDSQMAAMQKGVAHFAIPGANSVPGEVGNTVLSGHSSNDLFDPGDYKFIFAQLDKLSVGDTIYTNYKSKRYTYIVTKKEVVKPNDVNALVYPTKKPILTLITCTPLGTSLNRLLVTAEQVSPDPAAAQAAPKGSGDSSSSTKVDMPGNSPTLLERLFGAR